jgi:hypothetical protein
MDIYRKRLLWQGGNISRKFHLENWNIVILPKDQGGLGVIDLRCMNFSLLAKWIWRLESTEGLWQQIIRRKYQNTLRGTLLFWLKKKQEDSYFWKGLMNLQLCSKTLRLEQCHKLPSQPLLLTTCLTSMHHSKIDPSKDLYAYVGSSK